MDDTDPTTAQVLLWADRIEPAPTRDRWAAAKALPKGSTLGDVLRTLGGDPNTLLAGYLAEQDRDEEVAER